MLPTSISVLPGKHKTTFCPQIGISWGLRPDECSTPEVPKTRLKTHTRKNIYLGSQSQRSVEKGSHQAQPFVAKSVVVKRSRVGNYSGFCNDTGLASTKPSLFCRDTVVTSVQVLIQVDTGVDCKMRVLGGDAQISAAMSRRGALKYGCTTFSEDFQKNKQPRRLFPEDHTSGRTAPEVPASAAKTSARAEQTPKVSRRTAAHRGCPRVAKNGERSNISVTNSLLCKIWGK